MTAIKKRSKRQVRKDSKALTKLKRKFPKGAAVKATVRGRVIAHSKNRVLVKRTGTGRVQGFDPRRIKRA